MTRPLRITRCQRVWNGTEVIVRADRDARATFDSLLGVRTFFLKEGQTGHLRLRGKLWEAGDTLTMEQLVGHAKDWTKIPWSWGHIR